MMESKRPLTLLMASECSSALDAVDLIEGVLPSPGIAAVYGPPNCGKSFLVIDAGLHIAQGWAWHGQDTEQGSVLYAATESPQGVEKRVRGVLQHHGLEDSDVPLALVQGRISLLDESVAEQVAEKAAELRERTGDPVKLIVFDTLSNSIAGGDENASGDIMKAMNALQEISRLTDATIIIVHHSGKNEEKGLRGSSALLAAVDTSIEVTNENGKRTAWIRKQRDGETGRGLPFSLGVVELGTNPKGHLKTTCYVEHGEGWVEADKRKKLTDLQRRAKDGIAEALVENGQPSPGFTDMPSGSVPVVAKEVAERFIVNKMTGPTERRRKEQAGRQVDWLVANDVAGVAGDYIWLIR